MLRTGSQLSDFAGKALQIYYFLDIKFPAPIVPAQPSYIGNRARLTANSNYSRYRKIWTKSFLQGSISIWEDYYYWLS